MEIGDGSFNADQSLGAGLKVERALSRPSNSAGLYRFNAANIPSIMVLVNFCQGLNTVWIRRYQRCD